MTNGITTLSTTTNLTSTTGKQSVNASIADTGGTDLGNDPNGNPIPVVDGCGLLTLFSVLYIFAKRIFNMKAINSIYEIKKTNILKVE